MNGKMICLGLLGLVGLGVGIGIGIYIGFIAFLIFASIATGVAIAGAIAWCIVNRDCKGNNNTSSTSSPSRTREYNPEPRPRYKESPVAKILKSYTKDGDDLVKSIWNSSAAKNRRSEISSTGYKKGIGKHS